MADMRTSDKKNIARIQGFEADWKKLTRGVRDGKISAKECLTFEIPFIESTLTLIVTRPQVAEVAKAFAGNSFLIERSGLPSLIFSIDNSGQFKVKPGNGTATKKLPGIEFSEASLFIEGILGLSSREKFMKAYVTGGIKIRGLSKFRSWGPPLLAKLLKTDRDIYLEIVSRSILDRK
jgi:hypothetical protein